MIFVIFDLCLIIITTAKIIDIYLIINCSFSINRTIGSVIAADIEPRATNFVMNKTITKTVNEIIAASGFSPKNTPKLVATPLPPLKLKNGVHI